MVIDYLGIYGVCLKENKVLCIKKARGPYKNRFDLPGGSQKTSEGFTETLVREFLEETGYKVSSYDNCRVYDIFVEEKEAYPKDLKLNKVHMRTHRRSGLLISKFALWKLFRYFAGVTRQNRFLRNHDFWVTPIIWWYFMM